VLDVDLSRDGHALATAGTDGYGYVLDPAGITRSIAWFGDGKALQDVRFDPIDAHRVIGLERYGDRPRLWHWSGGQARSDEVVSFDRVPILGYSSLTDLTITPDGATVAAGDSQGGLQFWNSHTGRRLADREQPGTGYAAWGIAYDPTRPLACRHDPGRRSAGRTGRPSPHVRASQRDGRCV